MPTNERRIVRRYLPRTVVFAGLFTPGAFILPLEANAQTDTVTTAAVVPMRLGDLYAQVVRDNPNMSVAQALARAAQARVPAAKRPPDPQLQLGFMNYSIPGVRPMQTIGMTQLQIMQMVPLGGKLTLASRVAQAQADATSERTRGVRWELRNQTAMAFYDLNALDHQLDVSRETLHLLQGIGRTAESMYRVGEGRQVDVLRANVEIAKMTEDTLGMHAMRQTMAARINALLNRSVDDQIAAVAQPLFPDSVPRLRWLDSVAATCRSMTRAGLENMRAADAAAALANKAIIPDLQIGVQYGQRAETMTDAGAPSRTIERMGSLMIGASLPIFARDRQRQMRNEAEAMKAMAIADVSAMRADTRGRVGEAYASLTRARNLSRLYRTTFLPQAEAMVASALSSYRVGKVDFMTLLDDQMIVNKYRQELFRLDADEGKAWAELELLTGRELIDANSIAPTNVATKQSNTRGDK